MKDEIDVLLRFHERQIEMIIHQESQRTSAANLIIIVTAGLTGLVTFDGSMNISDLPLTILLIIFGAFGAIFSLKHYERFRFHLEDAIALRLKIQGLIPELGISEVFQKANERHKENFPIFTRLKTHKLWLTFYCFIAVLGIVMSILALW